MTALDRMGITKRELELCPSISDDLAEAFGTPGKFPRAKVLGFLAASDTKEAETFLDVYREMPIRDRESVPIEAICLKADVSILALYGAIVKSAKNVMGNKSALKAILAHPAVTEATIKAATTGAPLLKSNGNPWLDDRGKPIMVGHGDFSSQRLLHQALGFLPTPKGATIAFNLGVGPQGEEKGEDPDEDDDIKSFGEAFPRIATELEGWNENRRALTDGKK